MKMEIEVGVVRLKGGFVGQVLVADRILWESETLPESYKALVAAEQHVRSVFRGSSGG